MVANKVRLTFKRASREFCWGMLLCAQVPLNRGINYAELLYLPVYLYDVNQ